MSAFFTCDKPTLSHLQHIPIKQNQGQIITKTEFKVVEVGAVALLHIKSGLLVTIIEDDEPVSVCVEARAEAASGEDDSSSSARDRGLYNTLHNSVSGLSNSIAPPCPERRYDVEANYYLDEAIVTTTVTLETQNPRVWMMTRDNGH